jgi:hypothetical protein
MTEFDCPERLIGAVAEMRARGFRRMDAYSQFPVEGLAKALGFRDERVRWLALFGGLLGVAVGYGMQVYTNLDFPIDIGGRPLLAPPAFVLIAFELMVLFAVLFCIGGMLVLNHLPRLHHPVFSVKAFHLAGAGKFFLLVFGDDAQFDRDETRHLLEGLHPVRVDLVEHTEEPE